MRFIYDNIVAIQIALVCSAFAWLFGGTVPSALVPTMPWLLAILMEILICFPQRHAGETTYEARARVWRRLERDPLTWIVVFFTLLLLIPFFNKGLCPSCDFPAINFDGRSAEPPVPFIPFCVDRIEHLNVVLWFVPALTAMLAVKHALLKRGKRTLLELIVWNGLALSAIGMIQSVFGAKAPLWADFGTEQCYFFSTFGYPNMAGDYFTTLFGLSVALWRWNVEVAKKEASESGAGSSGQSNHKAFWRKHVMLIPAIVFLFSALMTLSRAAILLSSSLAILYFIHAFNSFVSKMKRVKRFKVTIINLVVLIIITTIFFIFMSDRTRNNIVKPTDNEVAEEVAEDSAMSAFREDFKREVKSVEMTGVLDRMAGASENHAMLALRVWKDHPFFGCGGWGYKHFMIQKMSDEEFARMHGGGPGAVNVHNDYLQFLAEHGAVGLILFFSIILLLVWPIGRIWKALIEAVRFTKPKDQPAKPVALFALPAPVFCILCTSIATMLHALADCPFRSPAILSLFFVSLASIDGFLPRLKEQHGG